MAMDVQISSNYKVTDLVNAYNRISFDATKVEMNRAVLNAKIANLKFAIDMAIDAGDRYKFLALSGQLKELLAKVGNDFGMEHA
ncbi:IDEAL domain-containing protein [Lysinibacillus sp. FSL K6-1151]|uniref:IDEAL domain-containing protein n=1 Tax=Lysinibacillus sp. FSL K6-1151 TaxID=2921465 RepID=UPI00315A3C99